MKIILAAEQLQQLDDLNEKPHVFKNRHRKSRNLEIKKTNQITGLQSASGSTLSLS